MIYLDNAATTFPKPECVYDKLNEVQRTIAVNVGRGSYKIASQAMQIVDETRQLMASLVGADNPECIVLTASATIAANELILGLDWDSYKCVYRSPFEHNAVARPLHYICKKYGIALRQLPFDPKTQRLDEDELQRQFAIDPPDYVFVNQVSNVTGVVLPVEKIARLAKENDAIVVVDGSQSVGLIPIDLQSSEIDYLIFAGHKNLYASWGIGGFVINCKCTIHPVLSGGTGSDSLNLDMPKEIPSSFESGSPNINAIASLNESIKWLNTIGLDEIARKKDDLMQKLISGLQECGVIVYLPQEDVGHTSVVSFNVAEYTADEVGVILSEEFDIAVRTGYHCAPFIHELLATVSTHGTVRVSVGYFNTEEDVDALISAVKDVIGN